MKDEWKKTELFLLVLYAIAFYAYTISRSLQISRDHSPKLHGMRSGWIFSSSFNDLSDSQWRNFRGNIPILAIFFGFAFIVTSFIKAFTSLRAKGFSIIWLLISLCYIYYLHGVCILFILLITSLNFIIVKTTASTKYFSSSIWIFNLSFLICNRIFEGYPFSMLGQRWAYLDSFRGSFRWHICFNFVVLRMISFGYDYHWANQNLLYDHEKHTQRCVICKSGKLCYKSLQGTSLPRDRYCFSIYISYLFYAPLYIAGPTITFNSFAGQLDASPSVRGGQKAFMYGLRWFLSFWIIELMTHLFHYNAFVISGFWKVLSPFDIFILGYGVLNFMWLKFLLIWRYFRFWSLLCGIEPPENMPRCINNCYNLESFWKNWHASFNIWLVRYMYIPLGGSKRKFLNIWVIFTFVAIWHDLEWKLFTWAWLTCLFFVPEMMVKSVANAYNVEHTCGRFLFREFRACASSVTITCLMVANLVGYVIGPTGLSWMASRFLTREGMVALAAMLVTFYVGAKDFRQRRLEDGAEL